MRAHARGVPELNRGSGGGARSLLTSRVFRSAGGPGGRAGAIKRINGAN